MCSVPFDCVISANVTFAARSSIMSDVANASDDAGTVARFDLDAAV